LSTHTQDHSSKNPDGVLLGKWEMSAWCTPRGIQFQVTLKEVEALTTKLEVKRKVALVVRNLQDKLSLALLETALRLVGEGGSEPSMIIIKTI